MVTRGVENYDTSDGGCGGLTIETRIFVEDTLELTVHLNRREPTHIY